MTILAVMLSVQCSWATMQGKVLGRAAAFNPTGQHGWERWARFQALSRSPRPLPTSTGDSPWSTEGIPFPCQPCVCEVGVVLGLRSQFWTSHWGLGWQVPPVLCQSTRQYSELRLRGASAVTREASLGSVLLMLLEQAMIMKEIWPVTQLQRCRETFIWCCFHSVPWSYYWFHLH